MSRVLVTGVNGFVGTHLASALLTAGHTVIGAGLGISTGTPQLDDFFTSDLTLRSSVAKLPLSRVDAVINLAGLAAVGKSFDQPDEYMRVNTAVLSVLCDEILRQKLQSQIRIVAISSGAVYDNNQTMPLSEQSKTSSKSSPYAASKLAMENLAIDYTNRGLQCIVARPFNHIGPNQGEGFLLPDLYKQLRQSLESNQPMLIGNLTTQRDYTDVRDVVNAYVALATNPSIQSTLYNVCSGKPWSGTQVLDALIAMVGKPREIIVDDSNFRPSDAPLLFGDNQKIITETGWQPQIDFKQTIADYVDSASS